MQGRGSVLTVTDLSTCFTTGDGPVHAVDRVSFTVEAGETYALVGESGCGKSVTAQSILRILPAPAARILPGSSVKLDGVELLSLNERQMRAVRGGSIAMIFQEPMTSLNPVFTCGAQIVEALELHQNLRGAPARREGIAMLDKVGIPDPARRFNEYPHQLSGGMRQRVMIAMALSCRPRLLIADEPTTALDVTIQAQILRLLKELQKETAMGIVLITHDLGVVAETADTVGVMYASRLVEQAPVRELYRTARHPYTRGLFASLPRLGAGAARLATIPGTVPNPMELPPGCAFHTRCPLTRERAALPGADTVALTTDSGPAVVLRHCVAACPGLLPCGSAHLCACAEVERENA